MKVFAFAAAILLLSNNSGHAADQDCPYDWAAPMAFGAMKNAKLVTNDQIDFRRTKATLIARERIGKDLWRQVHLVQYYRKSGTVLQAITVNDASQEECGTSDVQTFVISEKLLPTGKNSN